MAKIILDGVEIEVVQAKFHKWLELLAIREQIHKEADDTDKQASLVCRYLSASLSYSEDVLQTLDWREVAKAYVEVVTANIVLLDLPFLKNFGEKEQIVSWDYPDRNWWGMCRRMAKEFGWTIEYIENLDVSTAFHLLQEIVIDEQLEKEWQWLLSDRVIKYNSETKKEEPNPLPRPKWMIPTPKPAKRMNIPRSFLPVGMIVKARPDGAEYFVN